MNVWIKFHGNPFDRCHSELKLSTCAIWRKRKKSHRIYPQKSSVPLNTWKGWPNMVMNHPLGTPTIGVSNTWQDCTQIQICQPHGEEKSNDPLGPWMSNNYCYCGLTWNLHSVIELIFLSGQVEWASCMANWSLNLIWSFATVYVATIIRIRYKSNPHTNRNLLYIFSVLPL